MPTGDFWDVTDPLKPTGGPFDPDAKIDFPITVTDWLTALGSAYASHTFIVAAPLEVIDAGTHNAGVITPRLGLISGAPFKEGTKYAFTLRIVTVDGQQDDQSFFLRVKSK
jgi:hypothetical protein